MNSTNEEFLATIDRKFHLVEFWTVCIFTLLEFFLLTSIQNNNFFSFSGAILNIILTFVASLLVTINTPEFEVTAHYFEYVAQLLIIPMDLIFIFNEVQGESIINKMLMFFRREIELKLSLLIIFTFVIFLDAIALLIVYVIDPNKYDRVSHFMESTIEMANSGVVIIVTYLEFNKTGYTEVETKQESKRKVEAA
jgi:hypothetical protein